jgi:hypothetical protein
MIPMKLRPIWFIALAAATLLLQAGVASADYVNMTSTSAPDTTFNGGIFSVASAGSGTGIFPAFVQIQHNGTESAYNTTANNVLNNGSSAQNNHEIQAGTIATATIGGKLYFRFELDVNENNNATDQYISLDSLKVYTSTTANQSVTNPDLLGTKQYDMGTGNGVLLNYSNFSGSGQSDLVVFIPVWSGVVTSDYVYLYSAFGNAGVLAAGNSYGAPAGDYGTSDGFEEWAYNINGTPLPPSAPAPASLLLALTGVVGLGLTRFRRLLRKQPLAA